MDIVSLFIVQPTRFAASRFSGMHEALRATLYFVNYAWYCMFEELKVFAADSLMYGPPIYRFCRITVMFLSRILLLKSFV